MSVAIIAEFNPFHNGHIYLINQAKINFPNEDIIIILSGKYSQRGEINILSYWKRKRIVKKYGIKKVIKLPFKYATQAAHIFAKGAIDIVAKNKIDKIFFGSETGNISLFKKAAEVIINNNQDYYQKIKVMMKTGISFPKANSLVLEQFLGQNFTLPNDILGMEYVKRIEEMKYQIIPFCIKRTIPFSSEETISNFASATQLRKMIKNNEDISPFSPIEIKKYKCIENKYPKFQKIIRNTPSEKLREIKLVSEGMENLFKKNIDLETYDEFVNKVTSKRYTSSRIKRTMLYIILKIK
ncbi:MAG: nucleotidyltransferase [Metamycoplasmataceae bacterium]